MSLLEVGLVSSLFTPIDNSKPVYNGTELMVVENCLSVSECEQWVEFAERKAGVPAPVGNTQNSGAAAQNVQNQAFVADRINLMAEPEQKAAAIALYRDLYGRQVKKHYGIDIEWFEIPHILRYTSGGNYNYHADAEAWDQQQQCWVRGVDRDYSCVTYLNSDFTGGTLAFPYLNLRLHPRAGLVVIFPSDHRFLHSAEETTSGKRYAMVTWAAKIGSERVMAPPHVVRL